MFSYSYRLFDNCLFIRLVSLKFKKYVIYYGTLYLRKIVVTIIVKHRSNVGQAAEAQLFSKKKILH